MKAADGTWVGTMALAWFPLNQAMVKASKRYWGCDCKFIVITYPSIRFEKPGGLGYWRLYAESIGYAIHGYRQTKAMSDFGTG
jgi:hypothetical protein